MNNNIYIIAELCGQWGGSKQRIEQMIIQCKMAGADAVKIQLYDTFKMPGENRERWKYLNIDKEMLCNIVSFANRMNITLFASVFDEDRYQWTRDLGISIGKIASSLLISNFSLCQRIVKTYELVFCSLGKWERKEMPFDLDKVVYMHCVCEYPHVYNRAIELMPKKFESSLIGYSDHSVGVEAAMEAVKRGAIYIEKHFTTNHSLYSDTEKAHLCSMNYQQLIKLRNFCDLYVRQTC
jgi:sialic acid synthase SpsE